MQLTFYILLSLFFYSANGNGFVPSYIQPCDFQNNYEQCVANQIKNSLPYFTKGIPQLKVESLDPLHLDDVYVNGNALNLSLAKPSIYGLSDSKLIKFELDPDVRIKLVILAKNITMLSQYAINGRILVLPIQGHGDAVIKIDNLEIEIHALIDYFADKNGKHVKLVSPSYNYKMDKAFFQLDNLFNGHKEAGDATLKILNENWKQVMDDLAPGVIKETATFCVKRINKFFGGVTVDQIIRNYIPVHKA